MTKFSDNGIVIKKKQGMKDAPETPLHIAKQQQKQIKIWMDEIALKRNKKENLKEVIQPPKGKAQTL